MERNSDSEDQLLWYGKLQSHSRYSKPKVLRMGPFFFAGHVEQPFEEGCGEDVVKNWLVTFSSVNETQQKAHMQRGAPAIASTKAKMESNVLNIVTKRESELCCHTL